MFFSCLERALETLREDQLIDPLDLSLGVWCPAATVLLVVLPQPPADGDAEH
jgi:hypothetical protein